MLKTNKAIRLFLMKIFYNQNLNWHLYLQKHKILNIYKREKYETFRKTIQATKKPRYKNFR